MINNSKSTLAECYSRASHAIRTPLSIVMLELGFIEGERARRLEEDVAAIGEVVRKSFFLLKLYTNEPGDRAEFDLAELVSRVSEELRPACLAKDIDLVNNSVKTVMMTGYADAVQESARCLIQNAIAFTPESSQVIVSCNREAALFVEDSGFGFSDDLKGSEFMPFANPALDSIGVGSGLPIVQATAQLHGGAMRIERSELGGAKVILDLTSATRDSQSR